MCLDQYSKETGPVAVIGKASGSEPKPREFGTQGRQRFRHLWRIGVVYYCTNQAGNRWEAVRVVVLTSRKQFEIAGLR